MNVVREVYTSLGDEEFFPVQSFLEPEAQGWLDLAMIDPNTTIIPIGDATPLKVMEASTRLLNGSTKSGLGPETVTMIQARPRQAYAAWVAVKQQWEDAKKRLEEFRDVLRGGEGYELRPTSQHTLPEVDPETGVLMKPDPQNFERQYPTASIEHKETFGSMTSKGQVRAQKKFAEDMGLVRKTRKIPEKERLAYTQPLGDYEETLPSGIKVRRKAQGPAQRIVVGPKYRTTWQMDEMQPWIGHTTQMYRAVSYWISKWRQIENMKEGGIAATGAARKPRIAASEHPVPTNLGFTVKPFFDPIDVPETIVSGGKSNKFDVLTQEGIAKIDMDVPGVRIGTKLDTNLGYMDNMAKANLIYKLMQRWLRPDNEVRWYDAEEMLDYTRYLHSRLIVEVPFLLLDDTNILEMIDMAATPLTLPGRPAVGRRGFPRQRDVLEGVVIGPHEKIYDRIHGKPSYVQDMEWQLQGAGGEALGNAARRIMDSNHSVQGKVMQLRQVLGSHDLKMGSNTDAWTELAALIWKAQISDEIKGDLLKRLKGTFGKITVEPPPTKQGNYAKYSSFSGYRLLPDDHPSFNKPLPYTEAGTGLMNLAALRKHEDLLLARRVEGRHFAGPTPEEVEANQIARAEMYDDPETKLAEIQKVEAEGGGPVSPAYHSRYAHGEDGDFNTNKKSWYNVGLLGFVRRFLDDFAYAKRVANLGAKAHKQRTGRDLSGFDDAEVVFSMVSGAGSGTRERVMNVSTRFRAISSMSKQYDTDAFEFHVNNLLIYRQFDALTNRPELADKLLRMSDSNSGKISNWTKAEVQNLLKLMEGDAEYALMNQAADVIRAEYKRALREMVDYGTVSPELAAHLQQLYPEYIPIQYMENNVRHIVSGTEGNAAWKLGRDPIEEYTLPQGKGYFAENAIDGRFKLPTHMLWSNLYHNEYMGRLNLSVKNYVKHKEELFLSGKANRDIIPIKVGDSAEAQYKLRMAKDDYDPSKWTTITYRDNGEWVGIIAPKEELEPFINAMQFVSPNEAQVVWEYINKVPKTIMVHYNPTFPAYQMTVDAFAVSHQHGIRAATLGTARELFDSAIRGITKGKNQRGRFGLNEKIQWINNINTDEFITKMNETVGAQGWYASAQGRKGIVKADDISDVIADTVKKAFKGDPAVADNLPKGAFTTLSLEELQGWRKYIMLNRIGRPWTKFANALEMAPRRASARHVYRKGLKANNIEGGYSEMGNVYNAALALKRSTGDFTRGGTFTKSMDRYVAFMNISAQGLALPFRAMKNHPLNFGLMMMLGQGATYQLFQHNKNNPAYYDVPLQYRQGFIIMLDSDPDDINKVTGRPNPRFLRLPVPGFLREWALFYGTSTHVLEQLHLELDEGGSEGLFNEWLVNMLLGEINPAATVIGEHTPIGTPGLALSMAQDIVNNKNSMTGGPLVPDHLARRPKEDQWDSSTSIVARKAAPMFGMSPMQLDVAMKLPLIREIVATADIVLAAIENDVDPEAIEHARTLWSFLEHEKNGTQIRNVKSAYIKAEVRPEIQAEVENIIAQMERGVPVLGEVTVSYTHLTLPTNREV